MLRVAVLSIGTLCIAGGIAVAIASPRIWPVSVELVIIGALILLGTLLERSYRSRRATSAAWQRTGERFVDPVSSKLTEVLYNPQTGERSYETVITNKK